ncbi:MAG: D-glycero-beta-D-manno-heptose 1-phosphate adenylyltransferase [Flavobacteriales bacterium]|nr:D-glycero-beta-D-manno-heptose 1-phosphate adenylyltransferase [Flavobacteriales bacterium]MBK9513450.1 D-glycero-beta-D-manno-heptose 1-phosphate adenylyltransferase [Flavobacteriales bacterium]
MDLMKAQRMCNVWRMKGDRIVFTNGCFDILHRGHVEYLQEAAALGDRLVIGLNSDASVRRLGKGDGRPFNDQESRAKLLTALRLVDAVVLFDEDTPFELIKAIGPDVLVKGGDYTEDRIVGADVVKARGGEVRSLKLVEGYSTTLLVERIRKG